LCQAKAKGKLGIGFAQVYITERGINIAQMKVNLMGSLFHKVIK